MDQLLSTPKASVAKNRNTIPMNNISILDCTLRDGGRIIDCKFKDSHIRGIANGLTKSRIDIVEMGFLRSKITYSGNSTMFTEMEQMRSFVPQDTGNTMYVAFSDYGEEYGMWDFSKLPECDGKTITGIRVGYRKKDLKKALDTFAIVKDKGYKLFVQGVESLNYTDREMLEAVDIINEIQPYSFAIVDTYGAMYKDDVVRLYNLVNHNLAEDIALDFHSHNNLQLSFSFAIEMVELSRGRRHVILDATMEGLGKGTGNLNTELIVDYLNRKCCRNYDMDQLLDCIDEYIPPIKQENNTWTYQIPYFMAGLYSSHANNIIYLTDKHRLKNSDVKNIIMRIDPAARKRYNYDDLQKLYNDYFSTNVDDSGLLATLKQEWENKKILVLVPGASLNEYKADVDTYIEKENPVVISVNFVSEYPDAYAFFGNDLKYHREMQVHGDKKNILAVSNVQRMNEVHSQINYNRVIEPGLKYSDNSTVMLINLLKRMNISNITFAGFDGFRSDVNNYSSADDESHPQFQPQDIDAINFDLKQFLTGFAEQLKNRSSVKFLTKSMFSTIFGKE